MEKTLLYCWCERIAKVVSRLLAEKEFESEIMREIGCLLADRPHLENPERFNPPDDALLELVETIAAIHESFMLLAPEDLYNENKFKVEAIRIHCQSVLLHLDGDADKRPQDVAPVAKGSEEPTPIVKIDFSDTPLVFDAIVNRMSAAQRRQLIFMLQEHVSSLEF